MDKYNSIEEKIKAMNIKDYLHLYLGCEMKCIHPRAKEVGLNIKTLRGITLNDYGELVIGLQGGNRVDYYIIDEWQPILRRPLSDMTEEEINYIGLVLKEGTWNSEILKWKHVEPWTCLHLHPKTFAFLLSKHFDLFGLIEAGLAIDKTKLNSDNNEVKSKNNETRKQ
jgi:hypothetical protein